MHPDEEPAAESEAQLVLRRRNTALLADSFGTAGFEVVIDDVILWPGGLRLYLDLLRSRPIRFVVLAPRLEVVARRDAGRDKQVFELWRHLDDDLRRWTDQPGLRLDTSDEDAAATVRSIRQ
ncbi:MAG TPA: phosphotransferase, partial [Mycobacterium sp.]